MILILSGGVLVHVADSYSGDSGLRARIFIKDDHVQVADQTFPLVSCFPALPVLFGGSNSPRWVQDAGLERCLISRWR